MRIFNPAVFMGFSRRLLLPLYIITPVVFVVGIYFSLIASPPDYQQGELVRIMYVHVPSAWLSLGIYSIMAVCSFSVLVWQTRFAYLFCVSIAPIGACFAFVTLVTGSLWGKPIWGAWWVWDARLTSMFVLFLLYISYIVVINAAGSNIMRAQKPASVLALIGFINVPIVKFSVDMWYSLHQPASIIRVGGPAIHPSMMLPLLIMFVAFIFYFCIISIIRLEVLIKKIKQINKI